MNSINILSTHRNNLIDGEACRIFNNFMASFTDNESLSHFKIREEKPDVGIDYFIEYFSKGHPSGLRTGIQIKGGKKFNKSGEVFKKSIETKYLRYYLKVTQPVFIIIIDTSSKKAFWIHIQEYLNNLPDKSWIENKTKNKTINFSCQNDFSDKNKFLQVINSAHDYMRDMFPSNIKPAIDNKLNSIKKLDPRFDVNYKNLNGVENFIFSPNQDFEIDFIVKPSAIEKIESLRETGLKMEFSPSELSFQGSGLLELNKEKVLKYSFESAKEGISSVSLISHKDSSQLLIVQGLHTKLYQGSKSFTVKYDIQSSPFIIEATFQKDDNKKCKLFINFDFSRWEAQSFINLFDYSRIKHLIKAIKSNEKIALSIDLNGSILTTEPILFNQLMFDAKIHKLIEIVDKIKAIDTNFNLNLKFPSISYFTEKSIKQVLIWHEIVRNGVCEISDEIHEIKFKAPYAPPQNIISNVPEDVNLIVEEPCFMGKNLHGKKLTIKYSDVNIINDISATNEPNYIKGLYLMIKTTNKSLIKYTLE